MYVDVDDAADDSDNGNDDIDVHVDVYGSADLCLC